MRLSICIATYKRARFIGQTLDSIVSQLPNDVEVVVVDGASPDDTAEVVGRYPAVRYVREETNSGIDADYDKAVGYAAGEHCWLFPDDDLMAPGAIARVLEALEGGAVDLLIVDAEIRDATVGRTLAPRRLSFSGERTYSAKDGERLLADAGDCLSFIGGVIIRRSLWQARQRARYYGSLFIHVGVIFQAPIPRAKVLGEPLVRLRLGNSMWSSRGFEIWMFKWPGLIWSFDGLSDTAKAAVTPREPWRELTRLLMFRAKGAYGFAEYRRLFAGMRLRAWRLVLLGAALLPGRLMNAVVIAWIRRKGPQTWPDVYDLTMGSRFANPVSRRLAQGVAP